MRHNVRKVESSLVVARPEDGLRQRRAVNLWFVLRIAAPSRWKAGSGCNGGAYIRVGRRRLTMHFRTLGARFRNRARR